jgi:hypothetical protein
MIQYLQRNAMKSSEQKTGKLKTKNVFLHKLIKQ